MKSYLKLTIWSLLVCAVVTPVLSHPTKTTSSDDADNISIMIRTDGFYRISIRKDVWLFGAPTFFNADGLTYTLYDKLELNSTHATTGQDVFGKYQATIFRYFAGGSEILAAIKTYKGQPFIMFSQEYVNGANFTRAGNINYVISGFPSFTVTTIPTKTGIVGYLAYGGMMCGDTEKQSGVFSEDGFQITSGIAGGPIAFFDGSGDTVIVSPASNFMAASNWHYTEFPDKNILHHGIMGGVEFIPAKTVVDYIVYYSSGGVNQAFKEWGSYLRKVYKRTDDYVRNDLTINYLGYWTDNGAFYYYNTEFNKTYETTMLDTKAYADQAGIPYRYWQYDSWWYFKGVGSGVKTWQARPDIFPDGFPMMTKKLGNLPASAHNRYWSSDTTYAMQNGGSYNFVVEPMISVPNDQRFWDDLFANSSAWGLYTYEQDWLNKELAGSETMLSDVSLGATWLNQMANGAQKGNITIQYCMSNSRHILQALLNPVVTQARVSDDYSPGSDQWKIGVSSIFAYAMGIAPYKDNFWTTTNQPYNTYNRTEPHNELQTAVSVLSTGPVGPSDMIGHTNVSLLLRCCNAEGLILKPSKPATAVDDQIYKRALDTALGADGEVWSTYSNISGLLFGIIFVPEIKGQYSITPSKAGFAPVPKTLMVYEASNLTKISAFAEEAPQVISGCNSSRPCVYHATPVLKQNPSVLLLGELAKFVPVSPQRILSIDVSDDVILQLQGAPNERVVFVFSVDSEFEAIVCTFGANRTARLQLNSKTCQ